MTVPGVLIYRVEAPLIFANASVITTDIRQRIASTDHRVHALVLDFEAVYEVDTQGAEALVTLHTEMVQSDVTVVLARAHGQVIDYLDRCGVIDVVGRDAVYADVTSAVDATA